MILTGLVWLGIGVILILGCPLVPAVTVLFIHTLPVWIWLIVDSLLTVLLIYSLCQMAGITDQHNEYFE
jgi:hypothetical protein